MKNYIDLKIPKFNKKYTSVVCYFTKLKSFLSNYDIKDKETIGNCLILGLEGKSLELYCASDEKCQNDLKVAIKRRIKMKERLVGAIAD